MKKSWLEIYKNEIKEKGTIEKYFDDKIKTKERFINLIKKYSSRNKVIEVGCGTGIISTFIASQGYDVLSIDIDSKILGLASKIANDYKSDIKPKFKKDSLLCLNYKHNEFDVAFSNGVLEHFTDDEIIETLNKQSYIAEYVVFGIPTKYFNKSEAMYGDERYLKLNYWRKLIEKSNCEILEETSYHYLPFFKIILNITKYFRPYPFRVFVVKKKTSDI